MTQSIAPKDRRSGGGLESADGYELPAGAWEPEVLALRVKDYHPQWLDHLCFRGRVGWGRLSPPQSENGKPFTPLRSSPLAIFARSNLGHWLSLSPPPAKFDFSPDTRRVLDQLLRGGALFFGELMKQRDLLPSRIEQALAELTGQGWVTADSFEGMRALLLPPEKLAPFADTERKRRHRAVTSLEAAGRWSLLRPWDEAAVAAPGPSAHEEAVESFARALLHRYGVMFRKLLDREAMKVSWYDLSRAYRRLEARGEIRGGYFVGGVSGEQFALPEAIAMLRAVRKSAASGSFITISGADPLNLTGTLNPGPRVSAVTANRILLKDGVPVASLEAGNILPLTPDLRELDPEAERMLLIGSLSPALRPYYGS